jgi:plasmid stability protein
MQRFPREVMDLPVVKGLPIQEVDLSEEIHAWLEKRAAANNRTMEMEINAIIKAAMEESAVKPSAPARRGLKHGATKKP